LKLHLLISSYEIKNNFLEERTCILKKPRYNKCQVKVLLFPVDIPGKQALFLMDESKGAMAHSWGPFPRGAICLLCFYF
jgi:hypothetical protein